MDRVAGGGLRTFVGSAAHQVGRLSKRMLNLKPKEEPSKARSAAKFFLRTFHGMPDAEIDACVAKLWKDYRCWDEICRLTGLDADNPNLSVLDVGGGLTTVTRLFGTSRRWVQDICVDELRKGGAHLPEGIRFINGEAEHLPFPDGFFSHVFSTNALDHFEDPRASLMEMRRALATDGYCVIAVDVFPPSRVGEYRGIKHPHTFSEAVASELIASVFDVAKVFRQPSGGKVGFQQLVRGDLVPQREKEELIFVLQKRPHLQ